MASLDTIATAYDPWPLRRRRTDELRRRYHHADEMLTLYSALLEVQERLFHAARAEHVGPARVPAYVVQRAVPEVIDVTIQRGPRRLARGVVEVFTAADLESVVGRWLAGGELTAFETYLARAATGPVLEAIGPAAGSICAGGRDERHCPTCGGSPQLSYFAISGEALVTGPRYLVCSRCGQNWIYRRMTCAGCGEQSSRRLVIYREEERFPHVRVDGCEACLRYLLTFDLRRDTQAVPIVDELVVLPLDLYARERGMTKIVPNLMGN